MTNTESTLSYSKRNSPLMIRVQRVARTHRKSIRTERAYLKWTFDFLRFHKQLSGDWIHAKQMDYVKGLHQHDLQQGAGWVWMPFALADKYPNAARDFNWQYLFPARSLSRDPRPREAEEGSTFDELERSRIADINNQSGATIYTRIPFRKLSRRRFANLDCTKKLPAIHSDTALPLICWNRGPTSAQSRNCWDMPTSARQ